jgi:hypothetical protein
MSDNKPDYAKFMKTQSSPEVGKYPRDSDDLSYRELTLRDDEIPWAEIIVEPDDMLDYSVDADFSSRISRSASGPTFSAAPPIAVLVVVALVVFVFLFQ